MTFIVIARDKPSSLNKRLAVREQHIALGDEMKAKGEAIFGAALLDKERQMNGSVYVVDFPSRKELDDWLKKEPYVMGDVWGEIEILECAIGPSFKVE
jgi:uncharacterized protein YciI